MPAPPTQGYCRGTPLEIIRAGLVSGRSCGRGGGLSRGQPGLVLTVSEAPGPGPHHHQRLTAYCPVRLRRCRSRAC